MPSPCYQQDAGDYAVRHNPWTYFVDERGLCERFDQPIGGLDAAITGGQLPNMGYVAPNMCHDAHDCPLSQADAWFAAEMQKVFNGPDWVSGHLAVVLTADEDAHNEGNKVLTVVIHPSQSHDVVHQRFDHYSLYALFEDVLGLPHLHPGAAAPSLANAFGLPLAH
jgi:acid phosphatase